MKKQFKICCALIIFLSGCSAVKNQIHHGELAVNTNMSDTIFLDPVSAEKKTIAIQVRNTSAEQQFDIEPAIKTALINKGYTFVDPERAQYILQANVLKVGLASNRDASGYGGAVDGAVVGGVAAAGLAYGSGMNGMDSLGVGLGVSLLGALIGELADHSTEVRTYNVITDIQLSERASGNIVTETSDAQLKQGSSGYKTSYCKEQISLKKYQTRIISTAQKSGLSAAEAIPVLKTGLINSLAGLL